MPTRELRSRLNRYPLLLGYNPFQIVAQGESNEAYSSLIFDTRDLPDGDPTALGRNPATRSVAGPAISVTGVYENITVGKGSGDLEGMRVSILSAGGGHYAIVQIAEGGAEDPKPEFVEVTVKDRP